tara:strand:+ start:541 stop:1200 length:660 start_codon:yes stop_codon:yes gene_type:complete
MKFNFYFIHGWGFDKTFWHSVKEKIESQKFCKSTESLDLKFFCKTKQTNLFSKSDNDIFIVHSYGLNWFLKNDLQCKLLFNFFGAPDFVNYQKKPNLVKKKITLMQEQLKENPVQVLKNFYKTCNIGYSLRGKINIKTLINALSELKNENFSLQFSKLNFPVYTFYSTNDKVLNINKESLDFLDNHNHDINFLNKYDHGFPNTNPEKCFELIYKVLEEI